MLRMQFLFYRLICFYLHPDLNPTIFYRLLRKMSRSHHPYFSFKPTSRKRFSKQVHLIDTYAEIQIVAFHLEIIDFLAGKPVFLTYNLFDLA